MAKPPPRRPAGPRATPRKGDPGSARSGQGAPRERPARPDRAGRPAAKPGGPNRPERPAKPSASERRDRPAKPSAQERRERPAKPRAQERRERPAKPGAQDRRERAAKPGAGPQRRERPARPVRADDRAAPAPDRPERIAKLLARAGVASRRDVERLIAEGKVAVGGTTVAHPATLLTSLAGVTVEGKAVRPARAARLFLFHKPAGCLTTARDPKGRPTVFDLLPADLPRLLSVGRLDMNTEGLLLLTNDGELKRALELPANAVERQYRVRAHGKVSQAMLEQLAGGVTVEGVRYGPILADIERRTGANVWIIMRLTEGKNREVRRVLEHLGLQVTRLIRTAYGPYALADLPPRGIVEVDDKAVDALRVALRLARP